MEESVLLGTKPLVDSIRHSIRDASGVFSVCHAFACHIVQWRHDSRLVYFVEWTECVVASVLFRIMAVASRFVLLNDEQVKEFYESFDNKNTKRRPCTIWRFSKNFSALATRREIEDIAPVELQEIIKKFVLAVRKKNGEQYEPSSIRAFIQSIHRHLRKNNYGFSVLND